MSSNSRDIFDSPYNVNNVAQINKKTLSPLTILKRKIPRTAAITLTCGPRSTYAETLKKARDSIDLNSLGINYINAKRAITGGLIMEISGEDLERKTSSLMNNLRDVFINDDVKITRPTKKAELRVSGFDDSITSSDIIRTLSKHGECHSDDLKCSDIRIFRGMGSIWIKCPIAAAAKIMEKDKSDKLTIGWCAVRVELLRNRPMQCFKCFALGHPIQRCPSKIERHNRCLNCGNLNHTANACKNKAKCIVCEERGIRSDHRIGGPNCTPYPPGKFNYSMAKTGNRSSEAGMETEVN